VELIHVPSHEYMRGVHAIDPNLFPIEDPQAEGGTPLVYPSEQANSLSYNNAYNYQYQLNWRNIQICRGRIQITLRTLRISIR